MDRLLIVEPRELTLLFELGKKSHTQLRMRNVMHTMPVAFQVQSTTARLLSVKPAMGVIRPLGSVTVEVVMHSQKTLPTSGYPISEDKLVVRSVVLPGGLAAHQSMSSDWFSPGRKHVFTDAKLRLVFVGGAILRGAVSQSLKHSMEQVRQVLERDVDGLALNGRDEQGRTAMHLAVAKGLEELVQLLLEFGPNLEVKNSQGQMALHEAAMAGESLIVELLLAKGADPDSRNSRGCTALQLAITHGHSEVVDLLLAKGACFNVDMTSSSPSHAGPALANVSGAA